jgi:hypothetical protein
MTAEQVKRVAREALKAGGEPRLARQIPLSTLTREKGGAVLEKRLVALLDTVSWDEDRVRLAKMVWGERGKYTGGEYMPGMNCEVLRGR